ncbi:MAG: hypothetical protein Q4D62_15060 [Planctomycetia bacterium]|nr:hypothetical protein [Planctomycetia bacterium]
MRWVLQPYPGNIPTVKAFLLENRREFVEAYVEGLAAYLELISKKREKELQKELEEWDEYYRTRLPKFNFLAERPKGGPESYKEGWPKGLGRTSRYPDLAWPYMVRDSQEREEYIRMLPKAISWLKLEEIPKLRKAYAEMEPEIFNTFAFFYDSGRENMKELRKMLNEKNVPQSMQKKIFEEMKKPYDAGLRLRLSNERRRLRMLEENGK